MGEPIKSANLKMCILTRKQSNVEFKWNKEQQTNCAKSAYFHLIDLIDMQKISFWTRTISQHQHPQTFLRIEVRKT